MMKKFSASIEDLFSAEAEALTSNSADYIINQFQTNDQEKEGAEHPTTDNGRNQGSRTGNAAVIDPAIPGVPEGYSEESESDAASGGSYPAQKA